MAPIDQFGDPMQAWQPLLFTMAMALGLAVAYMSAWFLAALWVRRNDLADIAWGLGFVTIAWWGAFVPAEEYRGPRVWIVVAMVTLWGLRLATHIGRRNLQPGHAEDARYAAMRVRWGRSWVVRSYLQVFVVQAVLMWIVAFPIYPVVAQPGPWLGWLDAVGLVVWAAGVALESVADAQLTHWRSRPENRGRPLCTGVWAWSRHPNYFGDALQWWGVAIVALSAPMGYIGLLGALAMTFLLRYVSGVPLLEERHADDAEWIAYRAATSIFTPWPPASLWPGRRRS